MSLSVKRLIVNPNLPERVMLWLVEGKRPGYETVLDNPSATGRVLRVLADGPDWGIRCSVAGHVNTPRDVLVKLAHDDDECLALRGVSWDAGEWLRKHDTKGVR